MHKNQDLFAAVDLGSNSFHMIVARQQGNDLQVLDRIRESVRLADGMTDDRRIQPDAMQRGLACLARFGERLSPLPADNIRVVGTNTLRRARKAADFLEQAESALGQPIEIIAGTEEARLIYGGVSPGIDPALERRLVLDIGGGSTEIIAGKLENPRLLESLPIGCVTYSQRFFPAGCLTKQHWAQAVLSAEATLEPIVQPYRRHGWDVAVGTSGTIREIQRIVEINGWASSGISVKSLDRCRKGLLKAGHADQLSLNGLSDDRRPVIAGGLAVLVALFRSLKITQLQVSDRALRDGLLYDLIGRRHEHDVRSSAVATMATRYEVDQKQAMRVEKTALALLEQAASGWGLNRDKSANYLRWAARLHEVGLAITHNKHNRHGAYLVRNTDVAGLSQTDQAILSALVYLQRGKIRSEEWAHVPRRLQAMTLSMAVLLRLAIVIHRSRSDEALPAFLVQARSGRLKLSLPKEWLITHPLTRLDLKQEVQYLTKAGIQFKLVSSRKLQQSATKPL